MSKRRKTGIVVLCLLAVASFIWLDHGPIAHKRQSRPESDQQAKAYDLKKYHGKVFTVINVVDGDTIDIDAADGNHELTRIRLLGVDAPETRSEQYAAMYFGPEAAEFARELAAGQSITVYLDGPNPTRGKYGRLLAYVRLSGSKFLNEVLLTEGFAYADLRFRHSFYNRYKQLEAGARSRKKGLWQDVTREQLPQWLQEIEPNLLNK